ncbi:glycosyltransferase family 4 protein [Dolichospermum sp. ST_sed3]|nr:glycosyltransferase family 4 protein [Dolichospermum sp. ST_sed3]
MVKLNFLYFGKKHTPNGAARFVSIFEDNTHVFEKENIILDVFSLDNKISKKITINNNKENFRQQLIKWSHKSLVISFLFFYVTIIRNSKITAKKYYAKKINPDIILYNDIFIAWNILKANKNNNAKHILILHSDGRPLAMLFESFPKFNKPYIRSFFERKQKTILKKINHFVVLSENARNNLLNNNIDNNNISVIHYGINSEIEIKKNTPSAHNKIKLVSVGTICTRKGFDLLIDALAMLSEKDKNKIEIEAIGSIDDLSIIDKAKKMGVEKCLKFCGSKSEQEVNEILQQSDAFILCSRIEGMPIAIIEAMRVGLPIFASNIAGIPDMITHSVNGEMFNPNAIEIKNILENIANNNYNLIAMGENSKQIFLQKFSLEKMLNNYIDVFLKMM